MLRWSSVWALILAVILSLATTVPVAADHDGTPSATDPDTGSVRARPSPRPYTNPNAQPTAADQVRGSRPLESVEDAEPPRLDDPVLRWLPEISAASLATGTPISLIAGVMRVESSGDPEIVSPQGAQGLMQIMPAELATQGIPEQDWRDPKINVMAGAVILAQRSGGGWEAAAAYYFGIGCDYYGTCTYGYAVAIIGWANAYAALLGDPIWYDVGRIPAVPDSPTPTETPTPTPTPEASPTEPTGTPVTEPTTEPTAIATETATAPPTEEPTELPTELPTEEPTAEPAPTEAVTEPTPPDDGGGEETSG